MRNISIDFDPEGFEYYLNGPKYHSIITELNQRLRSRVKYEDQRSGNDHDTAEEIRDELYELWHELLAEDL